MENSSQTMFNVKTNDISVTGGDFNHSRDITVYIENPSLVNSEHVNALASGGSRISADTMLNTKISILFSSYWQIICCVS